MAEKGWTAGVATAAGAAAGISAAQLGLGYGLGVVLWPTTIDEGVWLSSLGWAIWITASATVFGAVIGSRQRGPTAASRGPWRFALATSAALGALVAVALIALPARSAVRADTFSPQVIAAGYAMIGVLVGLVAAYAAVVSRPVAANVIATALWLWALAVGAVSLDLSRHRSSAVYLTSTEFLTPTTGGPISWPGALLTLAAAAVLGAVAAGTAVRRKDLGVGAATSGAVGPLLVSVSFLALAPRLATSLGPLESAYLIAPYAVLAGLAGSALTVTLGQLAANRRSGGAAGSAVSGATAETSLDRAAAGRQLDGPATGRSVGRPATARSLDRAARGKSGDGPVPETSGNGPAAGTSLGGAAAGTSVDSAAAQSDAAGSAADLDTVPRERSTAKPRERRGFAGFGRAKKPAQPDAVDTSSSGATADVIQLPQQPSSQRHPASGTGPSRHRASGQQPATQRPPALKSQPAAASATSGQPEEPVRPAKAAAPQAIPPQQAAPTGMPKQPGQPIRPANDAAPRTTGQPGSPATDATPRTSGQLGSPATDAPPRTPGRPATDAAPKTPGRPGPLGTDAAAQEATSTGMSGQAAQAEPAATARSSRARAKKAAPATNGAVDDSARSSVTPPPATPPVARINPKSD